MMHCSDCSVDPCQNALNGKHCTGMRADACLRACRSSCHCLRKFSRWTASSKAGCQDWTCWWRRTMMVSTTWTPLATKDTHLRLHQAPACAPPAKYTHTICDILHPHTLPTAASYGPGASCQMLFRIDMPPGAQKRIHLARKCSNCPDRPGRGGGGDQAARHPYGAGRGRIGGIACTPPPPPPRWGSTHRHQGDAYPDAATPIPLRAYPLIPCTLPTPTTSCPCPKTPMRHPAHTHAPSATAWHNAHTRVPCQ